MARIEPSTDFPGAMATTVNAAPFGAFPVKSGAFVEIYVAQRRDSKKIAAQILFWQAAARNEGNPKKLDSAELGVLAVRRWQEGIAKRRVCESIADVRDRIQDNPHVECSLLLLARAAKSDGGILGLAHLRRTWCNHILLDYLAVHPNFVGYAENPYAGLGTGLLYFVVDIARGIEAPVIWGETTQNSVQYYSKLFGLKMKDLLYVKQTVYRGFQERIRRIWESANEVETK
jgi:hypothetical protein